MSAIKKCISVLLAVLVVHYARAYQWEVYYHEQYVDHFSFVNSDTYLEKYLYNDTYWDHDGGPIFFYTGNEADIETFANGSGFVWDIAPEFNALIIFAEHRYYGESLPYGALPNSSLSELGYLSAEQALADYASLIYYIKNSTVGAENSPVISFGGSYGGMLTAWFRMKYPHVVDGALSCSAPILQFTGVTPCEAFAEIVTRVFNDTNPECEETIRKSWDIIYRTGLTEEGRNQLTTTFSLCSPLKNYIQVLDFVDWLNEIYGDVAMMNYPYPAFFVQPLPAWPIRAMCEYMTDSSQTDADLLQDLAKAVNVYYNYTGDSQCFDINADSEIAVQEQNWDFQSCGEMVMPMCTNGVSDMFNEEAWDFESDAEYCREAYNITPRRFMIEMMYGATHLDQFSKILFSNGYLDPWSGGGVTYNVSDSVVAYVIQDGAHHLDLRGSDPADPQSVIDARNFEKRYIQLWIDEARINNLAKKSNPFLQGGL